MRERSAFHCRLALVLAFAAAVPAAHARGFDPGATPSRYLGNGMDSGLVTVTSPVDGRLWSAWSYRSGAESDIAVSVRDTGGRWTEPVFLGAGDGLSQVDPALVFDATGNLYLGHSVRETGQVLVSRLAAGATRLSAALMVSMPGERATAPTLMLVDSYLTVGYRIGPRVALRVVSLAPSSQSFAIQDGPDGFPPTRNETEGEEEGEPTGIQ